MRKNSTLLIIFVLISTSIGAQTFFSKKLEGRVYSKDGDVAATHVLNISTKKATITDNNGLFSIIASLNDTLVFSAVQFKKKEVVVTNEILQQKQWNVLLEDALTELEEVVVTPYNLSGDITKDLGTLKTDPVVTASTLGLPNAYVKPPTKAERELRTATDSRSLDFIANAISGRTKMLKERVARNRKYARTERVRQFYADSLYGADLKIPIVRIDDFMYFCEIDSAFSSVVDTHDQLKIWEFLRKKSLAYRTNNALD